MGVAVVLLVLIGCAIGFFLRGGSSDSQGDSSSTDGDAHAGTDNKVAQISTDSQPIEFKSTTSEPSDLMSLDPRKDGWTTEHFNDQANAQLRKLATWIGDSALRTSTNSTLDWLLTPSFFCQDLKPKQLKTVFKDQQTTVVRAAEDSGTVREFKSTDGFRAAMAEVLANYVDAGELHCYFKVFRIEPTETAISTRQYVAISGETKGGTIEQNSTWDIEWNQSNTSKPPTITSIRLVDFEEVHVKNNANKMFVDCTRSVFQNAKEIFEKQYLVGVDGWVRQLEHHLNVLQFGHNGLAVGDVNGDGLDDVYSCQPGGLPNRLLVQNSDGTVRDMTNHAGLDVLDNTRAALLIDLDNDGDQDLVQTTIDRLMVFENTGDVRFRLVREMTDVLHGFSLAASDYDSDGDLDLYVCVYYGSDDEASQLPIPMPMYDANNGGRNRLFRNDGEWTFKDVTIEANLNENNSRFSFAAVWEDYDNDGDSDLYVANDFGQNNLYRNDDGKFRDVTEAMGMVDGAFGMSAACGDFNRDGWIDFYKANMFSSAGNRVTYQPQFMPNATEKHRNRFRHMARGNTLFKNNNGSFSDVSDREGVTMGRWSWGSVFIDMNNDGWEDLFVTNGFMTGHVTDDL